MRGGGLYEHLFYNRIEFSNTIFLSHNSEATGWRFQSELKNFYFKGAFSDIFELHISNSSCSIPKYRSYGEEMAKKRRNGKKLVVLVYLLNYWHKCYRFYSVLYVAITTLFTISIFSLVYLSASPRIVSYRRPHATTLPRYHFLDAILSVKKQYPVCLTYPRWVLIQLVKI